MSRRKMAAYWLDDYGNGQILVRGTTDPSTAARYVLEHGWESIPWMEDDVSLCLRGAPASPFTDDAKAAVARWVEKSRGPERVGWFRMNVQAPGAEYGWMLGYADGPGRGNFRGVLFSA